MRRDRGINRFVRLAVFAPAAVCLLTVISASPSLPLQEDEGIMPAVYLNHLYIILDGEAYEAIASSEIIRNEFAGFEQATTQAGSGDSWTGTYIYGERTYIELFEAADDDWGGPGDCGIAFCVEAEGGIQRVEAALNRKLGEGVVQPFLQTMATDEGEVPWFHVAQLVYGDGEENMGFSTWVMEYHPEFLSTMAPEMFPQPGAISRREGLQRFFDPDKYLKEIVEIRMSLPLRRAETFFDELAALGWRVEKQGSMTVCNGPEITITVESAEGSETGIREIGFSLLREKQGQKVYEIGESSSLEFGDGLKAAWKFK
ncbi:MAG TPA: DUF5829 family protein [Acidobacteriota bacterium]|nr:DUF5829 family protein [Acidobacteriota bacterium]